MTHSSEGFCFAYLSLSLVRNFVSLVLRVSLTLMVRNFISLSLKLYNTSEKVIIMKEKTKSTNYLNYLKIEICL